MPRMTISTVARIYAVAIEIYCPRCKREDPIPAPDGSFMWLNRPTRITCPDCGKESVVSRKIEI